MKKSKIKIFYEPEADVLSWEVSAKPIDFAKEIGNVVVHFSKDSLPVLFEILDASVFLTKAENLIHERYQISARKMPVAVSR